MLFQSTHPRGVRLVSGEAITPVVAVSIHAPAWGATSELPLPFRPLGVSIHAPAWGATGAAGDGGSFGAVCSGFQSTHPRGVRRITPDRVHFKLLVSIHAPAWGATTRGGRLWAPRRWFQSTHPRGVRPGKRRIGQVSATCFNPRTRVGCDVVRSRNMVRPVCFNPRTRVGCDLDILGLGCRRRQVSIHAPAWGATVNCAVQLTRHALFQSTHPRGVRPC